jgi:hypothetical protein
LRRHSLICWATLAAVTIPSAAQIPLEFRYDRWQSPDRWEGITDRYPASGELIEPISAIALAPLPPAPSASKLSALFVLDKGRNVKLTVRIPADKYWMEPVDRSGQRVVAAQTGLNSFSWDSRVVRYLKRSAADLKAIAVIPGGVDGLAVAPVLLVDSGSPATTARVERYEFGFIPHANDGQVDVKYELKSAQGQTLLSDRLDHRPVNETFFIPWNASGQPEGNYRLIVHAEFPVRNQPSAEQTLTLTFRHVQTILLPKP